MKKTIIVELNKNKNKNKINKSFKKQVELEEERLIRGFSDVNFSVNPLDATDEIDFQTDLSSNDAKRIMRKAVPNGLNTFYPSDLERLTEMFKQPLIRIGRNVGVVLQIIGEPIIDPFVIKNMIGAENVTIEDSNNYIYSWD